MAHNLHIERELDYGLEHKGSQWFYNNSSADLDVGDVVILDVSDLTGKSVTTTTSAGDTKVVGVCQTRAVDGKRVKVNFEGISTVKVNGTTDIVAGSTYLKSYTEAGIASAASSNAEAGVFGLALSGYTANDSLGEVSIKLAQTNTQGGISAAEAIAAVEGEATLALAIGTTSGGSPVIVDSDIGSTVQAYDATIMVDADVIDEDLMTSDSATRPPSQQSVKAYVDSNAGDYTGAEAIAAVEAEPTLILQSGATVGGSPVVVDSDIGSTVQAYDATIVVDADIGSTVQAYSAVLDAVAAGTDITVGQGGTGASTAAAGFDALSPMTTAGDIIYGGASGTGTRLAKGTDADVLTLASGVPTWATPTVGDITGVTAGVGLSGGGTSGALTITLDLSELSTVTPADGDFFSTLDSDGANEQKTSTSALATLFAGTSLTASSSVISVDDDFLKNDASDTTTGTITAAGFTLADAANVSIGVPLLAGANATTTGMTAEMLAGGTIGALDAVCIHSVTQEVVIANASVVATARAIGFAPAAITDTETGTILLQGTVRDDTWTWTPGGAIYLSETGGSVTQTVPTTSGAFVQVVGVALSPVVMYFNPSMDVIELA